VAPEVLVVVEQNEGTPKRASLEAMTLAASLASGLGTSVTAVVGGVGAAGAVETLGRYGAANVVVVEADNADPNAWAATVAAQVTARQPGLVLLTNTNRGKDLGPRIAGFLDAPMASDCVEISVDGGSIVARRPVFAGKAMVTVSAASGLLVASLRPNSVRAEEAPAPGAVENATAVSPDKGLGAVLKEILAAAQEKLELTEADIIVSGGRGLKGPENFAMIEELAAQLGAAVGASRAVVDAGWRPHSDQVGQTGKTVAPQLYIAVGISGAIQHLAGMRTSKVIVAINKDPDAPIFKVADYGIVGDAFEIVPRLTEAVKELRAQA